MRLSSILISAVVAPLFVLGCDKGKTDAPQPVTTTSAASASLPSPTGSPAAPVTPTVETKMAEHFASSVKLRESLVKGDLEGFRAAAAVLSDKELSANLDPAWKEQLDAMRAAAKGARDAKTLEAAARSLSEVGLACAACHDKLGGPKLAVGEPPAQGSGAAPHMIRHQWAVDRMWEGLMAPSRESWTRGAEVFAEAPLAPAAVAGAKSVPPEVGELAKRAHAHGQEAHAAKDQRARAKSLADVYGTCVGCHGKMGLTAK